jgi:hypothetical protein
MVINEVQRTADMSLGAGPASSNHRPSRQRSFSAAADCSSNGNVGDLNTLVTVVATASSTAAPAPGSTLGRRAVNGIITVLAVITLAAALLRAPVENATTKHACAAPTCSSAAPRAKLTSARAFAHPLEDTLVREGHLSNFTTVVTGVADKGENLVSL